MSKHLPIYSLVVGDQQELRFDGKVFYSGPSMSLLDTINVIRVHFNVGLEVAAAAWKIAIKETVR